jgi:predicted kinase
MLIMVMGLPGSGKSYFAKKLAEELDAVYISSDVIRNQMGLRGQYMLDNKTHVYQQMAKAALDCIQNKQNVILDATFYLKRFREMIYSLSKNEGCPLFLIMVNADEHVIKQRLSVPRQDSEADHLVYLKIKDQFEPLERPFLFLNSTNENLEENLLKASQYIYRPDEQK